MTYRLCSTPGCQIGYVGKQLLCRSCAEQDAARKRQAYWQAQDDMKAARASRRRKKEIERNHLHFLAAMTAGEVAEYLKQDVH